MPTYEYACDACGHSFELQQRITEAAIKKCPKCGKPKARRMVGGGNFILKGGGWESDLYSGASNRAPPKEKKSESSTESSSTSDTKPSIPDKPSKKAEKKPSKKSSE